MISLAAGKEAFGGTYIANSWTVCLQLLAHAASERSATLPNVRFASVDVAPGRNDQRLANGNGKGGVGTRGTVQFHSLIAI